MQGNRDGSWSLRASANDGYFPQANRVFSSFSIHQLIRYNFQTPQQNLNFPRPQFGAGANIEVSRVDNAVNKTRKSLVAAGQNASSTRVSQLVLAQLQADPWRSLGMQIQDVPSLRQLMALEGKIIAFIHCFVVARRIMTLHDLEVAICRNEFVGCFDDLGLGPLLQHPLVLLYFPSISGSTGPVHITSEEIISFLDSYMNTYDIYDVKLDEFLNFVAVKKVTSKEKLGVRIQSLRLSALALRLNIQLQSPGVELANKELVTEALEEQIPTETTDASFVAGYDDCACTSSKANKPKPSRAMSMKSGSTSGNLVHEWNNSISTDFSARDHQLHTSTPWAAQAQQTGRKGEEIAYRCFAAKYGKKAQVRWVNEQSETGLPYDLIIENRGGKKEYVEVKATV